MRTTALDVLDRRSGNDAVARLKMWPGRPLAARRISFTRCSRDFKRGEESDGVQVALHGVAGSDGAPALVERLPPIEADHVGAGCSHFS